MNRWEIVFSGASLLTFLLCGGAPQAGECSNIRQRSDGCGPHPLIALAAASRPFGSNGVGSLNDVLRAVRSDPVVWPVMQNLLRRYDDCIRAADGLHYKRSDDSAGGGGGSAGSGGGGGGGVVVPLLRGGTIGFSTLDPEAITTGTDVIPWLPAPI